MLALFAPQLALAVTEASPHQTRTELLAAIVQVFVGAPVSRTDSVFGLFPFRRHFITGSGVVVRPNGLIVTSAHVVTAGSNPVVVLSDGRRIAARSVLVDNRSDLAVLKIDLGGATLHPLTIANAPPSLNAPVIAFGSPNGGAIEPREGVVTAVPVESSGLVDFPPYIETNAALSPGFSGGPLLDAQNEIVGVNTAIYSKSGQRQNVSFAIPARTVALVLARASAMDHPERLPWMGVLLHPVAGGSKLEAVWLQPDGPAAKQHIKVGEVIQTIDGEPATEQALIDVTRTKHLGDLVALGVLDGGALWPVNVILGKAPSAGPPIAYQRLTQRGPLEDAVVADLSPQLAYSLGLDPAETGVVVTDPGHGGAEQSGFEVGDVILRINDDEIGSREALTAALNRAKQWRVVVRRGFEFRRQDVGF